MMDGSMLGGMVHDCGPDHHMPVNGPMCDEYGRGRNVRIRDVRICDVIRQ